MWKDDFEGTSYTVSSKRIKANKTTEKLTENEELNLTLHNALATQSLKEYKNILDKYTGDINALSDESETPLHVVCKKKI